MYLKYYEEKASKIGNNFVFERTFFSVVSSAFRTLFASFSKYNIIT